MTPYSKENGGPLKPIVVAASDEHSKKNFWQKKIAQSIGEHEYINIAELISKKEMADNNFFLSHPDAIILKMYAILRENSTDAFIFIRTKACVTYI